MCCNVARIKPPTKCQDLAQFAKAFDRSTVLSENLSLTVKTDSDGVIQIKSLCQCLKCDALAGWHWMVAEQLMRCGLDF